MIAVFPGQGSQHVGMGKDLFDNFKIAKETFEEASDSSKLNLKKLCFDGPESDLTLTENTQPCLLTASVAAFRAAQSELGFNPKAVAGHSLGEYSALVAAGALTLGTAAKWVRERGAAMQRAVPAGHGSMAAVLGLDDNVVIQLCEQATQETLSLRAQGERNDLAVEAIVQAANFNSTGQVVIAGSADAVAKAIELIKSGAFPGGKAIALNVSAPFHCKLMGPARSRMAEIFSATSNDQKPKAPSCPYVPNRTARLIQEPGLIFEMLVEQVDHTVLWKQSMLTLIDAGYTNGVEFGPGKVLQGLAKRISNASGKSLALIGCNDSASLKTLEGVRNS